MVKQMIGFLVVLLLSTVAIAATAQDDGSNIPPEVKSKYEAGKAEFDAGNFEAAIAAFTEVYNLTGEPDLLFNLAACAERLGDAERAIAYYRVYIEEVPDAPDAETVRQRIKTLETEGIPKPAPEPEPTPEPTPEVTAPEPAPTTAAAPPPDIDPGEYYKKKAAKRTVVWPTIMIAAGAFVLAGGTTTAILANKKYKGLENTCKPNCTDEQIRTAKALAIASDVQFALGGAVLAGGVIGLVLTKRREKAETRRAAVRITPAALYGGGVLMVEGRF
jgi:tetratricopeptide (TPR) repeat protein